MDVIGIIEAVLFIAGLALFFIGYRKTNRNLMLLGVVCIFIGTGAISEAIEGWKEGAVAATNSG